jgi:long-chain acyl-CoA synthetase
MGIRWLMERMMEWPERVAIVWHDESITYGSLLEMVAVWKVQLDGQGVQPGTVVALDGDYSPKLVALMLALLDQAAIVVPLAPASVHRNEFMNIAEAGMTFTFDDADDWQLDVRGVVAENPLIRSLIELGESGLVIFSSGSTGKPKASLHNATLFLKKFRMARAGLRTVALPSSDHVAGLDTLFYTLSSGGMLITLPHREPYSVCHKIERYRAELLPASVTFLNLLLISEAHQKFDLSSLRIIAYGSEPMPEHSLTRLKHVFSQCKLINKYGTTEMGSPQTRSREDGSLWVKIDSEGFETKVVDGVLWIRAQSAMMGYLNAPSPFTEGGWFQTGDAVEVDGEHIRILGRKSEIINVGGEKVYPVEVENVIQSMDGVVAASVSGEQHPITGQLVSARVELRTEEPLKDFRRRMQLFCRDKLPNFKIPQKVIIVKDVMHGHRFKKMRGLRE